MRLRTLLLISTALVPLAVAPAHAGPNGANVVGGAATVQGQGTANVTVNQSSQSAIINWRMFDIGVGEKTTFNQPNGNSIALNRVTGGMGPSQILGSLQANGKVFVINRDGIIFGAGAVINTAGFLATTSDIRNEDFMAGRFNFNIPGRPDASIVNMGTITAASGGFAALVAPGVRNSGTITANLGSVVLGAGNLFTLDFYGDRLITLGIGDQIAGNVKDVATGQTLKSLITNEGKLKANGGRVELTAAAARQVVDSVINTSGVIEANTVGLRNGRIVLGAATAGTKGAGLPTQTVKISGTLSTAGKRRDTKGGKIIVTGENIELKAAAIDASGRAGGGTVMIGGDWGGGNPDKSLTSNQSAALDPNAIPTASTVSVDAASRIDASAKDGGNGGKVILWSDQTTNFAGTILALGGREFGNGGFVETSGHGQLNFTGNVNTSALNGKAGTLLLDPADFYIDPVGGPTRPPGASVMTNIQVQNLLALNNVVIATNNGSNPVGQNGDIFVTAAVVWNTNFSLTLEAFRNIVVDFVGVNGRAIQNTAAGNLVMHAGSTGTGAGTITLNSGTFSQRIDWSLSTGTVSFYYNPTNYASPTNFTTGNGSVVTNGSVPNQFTAYMLVNTEVNLQNVSTNLSGNYALGKDINANSIPNFTPIGNVSPAFSGIFDGLGHTISNLHIAPTTPSSVGISVGMFSTIGATGVVRNLTIDNASVTANPNVTGPGQFVGVLAGTNAGLVSNVTITNSTVSHGTAQNGVIAGGLVGQNGLFGPGAHMGVITVSSAAANVTVGSATSGSSGNSAGGLVGDNPGTITQSFASGNVSGGANSFIGGLAGRNESSATIDLSGASGNVSLSDATGSGAGGLVGFNFGAITNSVAGGAVTGGNSSDIFRAGFIGGLVGLQDAGGTINTSFAIGDVSAGSKSSAGGLVGANNGTIIGSGASGAVFSLDNFAGGLVGFNGVGATIAGSVAIGNVSGGGFNVGGLVGDNAGTITGSSAFGNVTATALNFDSDAGGFAGNNSGSISSSFAFGNITGHNNAGGFVGGNGGLIDNSFASGTVAVTDGGTAGGFVGGNHGLITNSAASGAVTGGANSALGGFAAGNLDGTISDSIASGAVTSTGQNSVVGGFAGVSVGDLVRVTSTGPVSGTSESYLGGLVGINVGLIQDSSATGTVSGSGSHNIAGGLVGMNFGFIDPSFSSGNVTSGANSIVGGFVGANGAIEFPDGFRLIGTVSPGNSGSGSASGGAGSTVGPQVGQDYPVAGLPELPTAPCQGDGGGFLCEGKLFKPNGQDLRDLGDIQIQRSPLVNITAQLVNNVLTEEKKPDEVVQVKDNGAPGSSGGASGGNAGQKGAGNAGRPPANVVPAIGLGPLPSGMPPIGETRYSTNEIVVQLGLVLTQPRLLELASKYGLEVISSQTFGLLGRTVYRFRITGGLPVIGAIAGMQSFSPNISAQPSYNFILDQGSSEPAAASSAPADTSRRGDSAQYIVTKLGLVEAHGIATGKGVKIAVIDSEIDANHPDLQGVIAGNYDALPSDDQRPHPHGTGMAGAIGSHQRLLGIAPGARILAVRAFGVSDSGAQGTSMNIVKGLEWAVKEGAQVINMSFAGPRDPILEQAIKALKDRGIILIGAAGNAGPKSPPLFPGADPNVIAVSATDMDDKTYKNANRGKQVAIAAPGVDILVPAPEGGYQLTTGTSVAAAHISGVVALMLERNPKLSPNDVRNILAASARKLPQGRNEIGAGLVDPMQALSKSGPKQAAAH